MDKLLKEVLMIDCLSIVETDKVIHTVETDIVKLVVEIESFGMNFDEFDKETGSSDGLQPKQADLSCVHALNELHLHEIHVFPSTHEADQYALAKVYNLNNVDTNMINQAMQAMPSFEQLNVVNCSETEITKDLKENESLMQTVTLLKNDFKKEESRNIDREIALEKRIKQLDNIKAQQLDPKLYDGNIIEKTSAIVILDSEETPMLAEESRSKMLLKQKDPMMLDKKVNTTPNSMNSPESTLSSRPTKVKVPKEFSKVSMVNTSLKKLKHHLAGFDMVVKERTTATAITEGSWGFEHTKACFTDQIIPSVKALKDIFNTFDQYLIDELTEVQNVFHQMEHVVEQHRLESKTFEIKMNQVLNENERLLEQVINKDIVNIVVSSTVDNASVNAHAYEKCLKLETKLPNKKDFIEKETYDKLFRSYTTLEKHCISLEVDTQLTSQLTQEIFQRDNSVSNYSAPSFDQITTTTEVPYRKPIAVKTDTSKPVVTLVYSRKSRKSKSTDPVSKSKVVQIVLWYLDSGCSKHMIGDRSQLTNFVHKFLGTIKFKYDHVAKIMGYGDYQIGNITISRIHRARNILRKHKHKTAFSSNLVFNKPALSSTRVKLSISASRSQPSGNTKKDKIKRPPRSTQKNKVEAHPETVKSSLKTKNCAVKPKETASVHHSKLNANSKLTCVKCNGFMLSDNHDLCVLNDVNARVKSKYVMQNIKRKV
nr:integrase, catalytic region, zinc finger, CCHC-type, peptidase aspartic, catalytic [Tanacetum cinerariifolium]